VQGYKGLRIVTEISDIKTEASPELFAVPTDLQKIESAQVRAQVDPYLQFRCHAYRPDDETRPAGHQFHDLAGEVTLWER
jgi:hypothetical protein